MTSQGTLRWLIAVGLVPGCYIRPEGPMDKGDPRDGDLIGDTTLVTTCASYGPWGTPKALAALNLPGIDDMSPALSGDNRRLVFHRESGGPTQRLFEAVWDDVLQTYTDPTPIVMPAYDGGPTLSPDGLTIWFTSYYEGSEPDIWIATRPTLDDPFDLMTAGSYVPFATAFNEYNIAFSASLDDAVLNFGSDDIYIASRSTNTQMFGTPQQVAVASQSSGGYDCCPGISPDGLTIIWQGYDPYGMWEAQRQNRGGSFSPPTRFEPLRDSVVDLRDPQYSYDGTILVYAGLRPDDGTEVDPHWDLYMLRRDCMP